MSASRAEKLQRIVRTLEPALHDERTRRMIEELMGDKGEDED